MLSAPGTPGDTAIDGRLSTPTHEGADDMNGFERNAVRELEPLATGPTIKATHDQSCGWCRDEVRAQDLITYTREAGWCHASCTTDDVGAPTELRR